MDATNKVMPAKKRSYEAMAPSDHNDDKEENFTEQEMTAMSRSERKRHREKKRRSDVNKGFDELMGLLLDIDPEVRAEAEERASKGQCKRSLGAHEDNVLSRVDLIATAIKVLKRVNGENEKHKKMVEDLLKGKADPMAAARPPVSVANLAGPSGGSFNASFLDRASLLQKSTALGLSGGGPSAQSAWDSAQQLRAAQAASLFGNASAASAPHQFGGFSSAELMALRAAAGGRASASAAASDAGLLAQLNQRNQFLQSILNNSNHPASSGAPHGGSSALTEALYGALGPGQMPGQNKKDP